MSSFYCRACSQWVVMRPAEPGQARTAAVARQRREHGKVCLAGIDPEAIAGIDVTHQEIARLYAPGR